MEAAKESVEGICTKIYNLSVEHSKKLREKHLQLLEENNIRGKLVVCTPTLFIN